MPDLRWLVLCAAASLPFCAHAQTPTMPSMPTMPAMPSAPGGQQDMVKMLHLAAHNQLGIIEYCKDQGSVGDDVVALQKRMLGMLPPAQVDGLDAAEAAGRKGLVQVGGNEVDIKQAAQGQNTTTDAMCKQIGTMLQAQAVNIPK